MILLQNGTVIDPKSGFMETADIAIDRGKIIKIGKNLNPVDVMMYNCYRDDEKQEIQTIDCTGKIIGPGLVDIHVHFRDPGFTYKEDILTGGEAAKRGGFTSIILMANTKPVVDSGETIHYILEKGKKTKINIYTCATITKSMQGKELNDFFALKNAGAIGFTDDGIPMLDEELVTEAMIKAAKEDVVLSFHEENPEYIKNNGINHGKASQYFHIEGSDRQAEITMVKRDLKIALETGAKVNFQHISTKEAVELIRTYKSKDNNHHIHAEATPHHMSLNEQAVILFGTLAKMNPPLREEEDRKAIIEGLMDGTIDIIATDHAPHTKEEKDKQITEAPSGIIGLETAFSIAYEELICRQNMPILQLFCRMSLNPAKLYQINAGYLAENGPADVCIVDTGRTWSVKEFASKSQNSPFKNQKLMAKVIMTICNGKIVYKDDDENTK